MYQKRLNVLKISIYDQHLVMSTPHNITTEIIQKVKDNNDVRKVTHRIEKVQFLTKMKLTSNYSYHHH